MIIADIQNGIPLDFPCQTIIDRKEAIKQALLMARPGDCIVIAGKGHETYQEIKGVRHHFDDREVIRELAASLTGSVVHG
jgi:UDP-N-acetylmuramoyl-L-alanyl-D-glutamate--2,6-diaminopimelate ligase